MEIKEEAAVVKETEPEVSFFQKLSPNPFTDPEIIITPLI